MQPSLSWQAQPVLTLNNSISGPLFIGPERYESDWRGEPKLSADLCFSLGNVQSAAFGRPRGFATTLSRVRNARTATFMESSWIAH
jgi:hypothetical protein